MSKTPFFIGWAAPPKPLRPFLLLVAALSLLAFALAAYVTAATQNDPGAGAFRWDWGPMTLTGTLETKPYPVLHVTDGEHGLAGQSILLSGVGKRGAQRQAEGLEGMRVAATGIMLTRGDLLMMQVRGNDTGLVAAQAQEAIASTSGQPGKEALGSWKLTGEICDGKCYAGAMRPGTGLAHRACANLCLTGGAPPVFVATGAVDGAEFFLMGDENGEPLGVETLKAWTALRVTLSGTIERRGTMPLLFADLSSVELAQ
ncbi:MAG: hypothetical protein AAFW98_00970 [Pseudomonadota bacterium]